MLTNIQLSITYAGLPSSMRIHNLFVHGVICII